MKTQEQENDKHNAEKKAPGDRGSREAPENRDSRG